MLMCLHCSLAAALSRSSLSKPGMPSAPAGPGQCLPAMHTCLHCLTTKRAAAYMHALLLNN